MFKYLIVCTIALLLFSCAEKSAEEFQIPEEIIISNPQLISPFFIEQLTENPLKEIPGWNDSLIALLNISQIILEPNSTESDDYEGSENKYCFRRNGELYCFCYYSDPKNTDSNQEVLYHSKQSSNTSTIQISFSSANNDAYVMLNRKDGIDHIRKRKSGTIDSLQLFGAKQFPEVMLKKSGDFVLSADFTLSEDAPLSDIVALCEKYHVNFEAIKNADLSVTYTNRKQKPVSKYRISNSITQGELLANWEYSNEQLTSYSRFVNGNLVKEFSFEYGHNKLIKSFVFNQLKYSIQYK